MARRYTMEIRVLRYLIAAVVGYALLTGGLFLGQRRLLYLPDRTPPDLAPLARRHERRSCHGEACTPGLVPPARDTNKATRSTPGNADISAIVPAGRPYLDAGHGVRW